MAYSKITVEIANICNARCKWGKTGMQNRHRGGVKQECYFMNPREFERGIEYLTSIGCLDVATTELELYNWGEPLLNPHISEIVEMMERREIKYHLSSNAYSIDNFKPKTLNGLTSFRISISGVTKETYERIYGLDVERVKKNIYKLADLLDDIGKKDKLEVSYLVYRFNANEILAAKEAFKEIRVVPRLAYFVDFHQCQQWLEGNMPEGLLKEVEEEIIVEMLRERLNEYREDFECPQWKVAVFDEKWNLLPCCLLTSDEKIGNLFELSAKELEEKKKNLKCCEECIRSKQHWICNTNKEIYFGSKEAVVLPYMVRNKELKEKYQKALDSYSKLKEKYGDLWSAYQKLEKQTNGN